MPWWAASTIADERRQAMASQVRANRLRVEGRASAASGRQGRTSSLQMERAPQTDFAASGRMSGRQSVGHHVGNWLIRAGTRLGGATMRTS
jgi:hypothetical protein